MVRWAWFSSGGQTVKSLWVDGARNRTSAMGALKWIFRKANSGYNVGAVLSPEPEHKACSAEVCFYSTDGLE